MKRLHRGLIGVDHGSQTLVSDVEHDGPMWTGDGPREARVAVTFSEPYRAAPVVQVAMSMWDADGDRNQRADLRAEGVTAAGFEIVFRTWGDSRVARVRADWIAIGEILGEDDWDFD
jgi:hypothetical protein